jgi:hypothetical protein
MSSGDVPFGTPPDDQDSSSLESISLAKFLLKLEDPQYGQSIIEKLRQAAAAKSMDGIEASEITDAQIATDLANIFGGDTLEAINKGLVFPALRGPLDCEQERLVEHEYIPFPSDSGFKIVINLDTLTVMTSGLCSYNSVQFKTFG